MAKEKRFDLILTTEKSNQRLAPRGGEAFLRNLATLRLARPVDEAVAEKWVEVYCEAGATAHEAFITANEARSAGQKVFFSSVGNNLVSQAADLADRANVATNGIVGAAYTIGQTYYSSHDAVRVSGLLPAVLNNGRDLNSDGGGTRPGGGGGQ